MENYPKKPKARRKRINFRISEHENNVIFHGYYQSGHEGTCSAYCRDILLGNRIHPNFEDIPDSLGTPDTPKTPVIPNVGYVIGPDEARIHIQAMVIATLMLRIKSDPAYQKVLRDNREAFIEMVARMRGYEYDDKTGLKSPLPGDKVRERED